MTVLSYFAMAVLIMTASSDVIFHKGSSGSVQDIRSFGTVEAESELMSKNPLEVMLLLSMLVVGYLGLYNFLLFNTLRKKIAELKKKFGHEMKVGTPIGSETENKLK
jgi:hypothetical protein